MLDLRTAGGVLDTSLETRAHLNESIARIDDVLKANMQRVNF